jgi:hypothetical protein
VKRVQAQLRARTALADRAGDPGGHVRRDQFDLLAALLAAGVEERLDRLAVAAGGRPHQPSCVVADDDGHVALAGAMADLVDPDPPQAGEEIDLTLGLGGDALADPADAAPGDPHELRHGGLGAVDGQPRDLVLERAGEPGLMACPGDRADHDPVTAAGHPGRVGLHERQRRAEVKPAPSPAALAQVEPRRPAPADATAIASSPVRPRGDHDLSPVADPHVLDDRPPQAKQPRPYPCTAHAAPASPGFQS